MKLQAVVLPCITVLCSLCLSADLVFEHDSLTPLTFSSDGIVQNNVQTGGTPPSPLPAGSLVIEQSGPKLWIVNDVVNIAGAVTTVSVTLTDPLVFENTETNSKVELSAVSGDMLCTEPHVQQVESYIGSRTIIDDRADEQHTEFESFGEGRIEYITADNGTVSEQVRYYYKDHLGSTRVVVDENGTLVEATRYSAYGEAKPVAYTENSPPTSGVDVEATEKFTGKEYDDEGKVNGVTEGLKLSFFGARYYDAEVGLWMSPDPKREFWNSYRYTTNPIGFIDLGGLEDRLAVYMQGVDQAKLERFKKDLVPPEGKTMADLSIRAFDNTDKGRQEMYSFLNGAGAKDKRGISAHGGVVVQDPEPDDEKAIYYTEGGAGKITYEDLNKNAGTGLDPVLVGACFAGQRFFPSTDGDVWYSGRYPNLSALGSTNGNLPENGTSVVDVLEKFFGWKVKNRQHWIDETRSNRTSDDEANQTVSWTPEKTQINAASSAWEQGYREFAGRWYGTNDGGFNWEKWNQDMGSNLDHNVGNLDPVTQRKIRDTWALHSRQRVAAAQLLKIQSEQQRIWWYWQKVLHGW